MIIIIKTPKVMTFKFDNSNQKISQVVAYINIWSNYSDLTRPHPKWWFSKGNALISGKSRLVKYYNLARNIYIESTPHPVTVDKQSIHFYEGANTNLHCSRVDPIYTWNLFVLYFGVNKLSKKKAQTPSIQNKGSHLGSRYIYIYTWNPK